jgi:hypothetical protein
LSPQTHFGNFAGNEAEFVTDSAQKLYVSFPVVPEGKTTAQIDFPSVQSLFDYISQEVLSSDLRKLLSETYDYGLFDSEDAEAFHLLV